MRYLILFMAGCCFTAVNAQKGLPPATPVTAAVTTAYPQHEDFAAAMLSRLRVPAGFSVSIAATGLGKPRMMELSPSGALYITRRDQGDVLLLTDTDSDGKFDDLKTVVSQFKGVHGIARRNDTLYLCSNRELKRYRINPDNTLTDTVTLFKDLPDGGQHGNRTMAFGPDGFLYMSIGSTCNDCAETNPENATMLRIRPDSLSRKIYARGLRNTIGFDWHPQTRVMWGMDNGTDWRGDEIPPEELNRIIEDGHYGWPLVFGKQVVDPTREDPPGSTKEAFAKTTEPSVLTFPAHSAPINFKFLYPVKSFSEAYRSGALVTWHGSWNKSKPDGYKVQLISFENGEPQKAVDFLKGFLSPDGKTRFGRPAGLAVATDRVYISDDENGIIYVVKQGL